MADDETSNVDPQNAVEPSAPLPATNSTEEMTLQLTTAVRQQSDDILALVNTAGSSHREEDDDVLVAISREEREASHGGCFKGVADADKSTTKRQATIASLGEKESSLSDGTSDVSTHRQNPKKSAKNLADDSSATSIGKGDQAQSHDFAQSTYQHLVEPGAYRVVRTYKDSDGSVGDPIFGGEDNLAAPEAPSTTEPPINSDGATIEAVKVEPDIEEQRIRNQILNQAAQADIVVTDDNSGNNESDAVKLASQRRTMMFAISIVLFIGLVVGLGVGLGNSSKNDSNLKEQDVGSGSSPTNVIPVGGNGTTSNVTVPVRQSTLKAVQDAGILRCGIPDFPIFYDYDEDGNRVAFDIDLVRWSFLGNFYALVE